MASSSKNPQLGPEPFFNYPTPTNEQLEDELPPYFQGENVPLGVLLDRLSRKGYGDLRVLVGDVLPSLNARQKPKHIIDFAKTTRHALLKYLAVLRWKTAVDIPTTTSNAIASTSTTANANGNGNGANSFPTPHSNGDSETSPGSLPNIKGKGKARATELETEAQEEIRGKVTDAKRIAHFMAHQNKQHDDAVEHIKHVTKIVEGLRERNPDLLTALSLLTEGTYTRLPSALTETFLPKPALTNGSILSTLRRLNRQLRYRLRSSDYLPPELIIEDIRDGRVYVRGGGKDGWKAEMTVVGFAEDSRWWLTGVDWGWKTKEKGVDDPGGDDVIPTTMKRFAGEERQQILDLANLEVLAPKDVPPAPMAPSTDGMDVAKLTELSTITATEDRKTVEGDLVISSAPRGKNAVDAPLVRLYNFIQHLSLSYQLEVLFTQAIKLSQGKWRGHIVADIDRKAKVLRVKYWVRPRPPLVQAQQQAAVGKRPTTAAAAGATRTPLFGGILSIALIEGAAQSDEAQAMLGDISSGELIPNERVLNLELGVKWEIDEAGVGGGLKVGDIPDGGMLRIDPSALNLEDILLSATRNHAAHLTRAQAAALIASPRIVLSQQLPTLIPSDDPNSTTPLILQIPLPGRQKIAHLAVSVSARNGLVEIDDSAAKENEGRAARVKLAMSTVNEGKTRLLDDIGRLTIAIITENMEDQMRQLGWRPTRRLALRSQDLAKADLHPATTIFVPLPVSPPLPTSSGLFYFVARVTPQGIAFELLRLVRVMMDHGLGAKLVVGDKSPMDLQMLRARKKGQMAQITSTYEVKNKDLQDLFIYTNALVAQGIIEQQLISRSIPYSTQLPPNSGPGAPRSTSPLAGLIPTICVNVGDLLRDGRSAGAAVEVAMPRVCLQIDGWWKGGLCEVVTIVQLRHQPPQQSTTTNSSIDTEKGSAQAEGISFDPSTSVVTFRAKDISRCVPSFLEQWERLSKVVIVAGEVSRLNKLATFDDVKMLSFDLRTATLSYKEGYNASITYTPNDDSYQVTFFCNPPLTQVDNPHVNMAHLLSARLNELTSPGAEMKHKGAIGKEFVGLLRGTLPFLLAVKKLHPDTTNVGMAKGKTLVKNEDERDIFEEDGNAEKKDEAADGMHKGTRSGTQWTMVILSVQAFRLVKDHRERRYALDIILLPDTKHYLFRDASLPRGPDNLIDIYTGELSEIDMIPIVQAVFDSEKQTVAEKEKAVGQARERPPLMRLDGGKSLSAHVERVESVLLGLVREVDKVLDEDQEAQIQI